ncbi:MAG: hypothetical protein K6B74_11225 [Ruminococcus sp.]|nr:hypothetical protein [Ruminococcus sp.]
MNYLVMKKTIGLLAALTLTLSSMGVAASGAEFIYGGNAPDTSYGSTGHETDIYDPGYIKAQRMQAESERNAGGGPGNMPEEEKERRAELTKQTLNSSNSYIRYTDSYIYHNSCFDNSKKTIGIDVSEYQAWNGNSQTYKRVDWNKVKADGIEFAIIRVGYRGWGSAGSLEMDDEFQYNLQQAKAAGVKVGVYFYTQAVSSYEARQEAQYVLDALNGVYLDMPVYYDIEAVGNGQARLDVSGLSKAQKTDLCRAFCDEIEKGGYTAGVYSYRNYFYSDVDGPTLANEYPVWLADYSDESPYTGAYHMWQFASSAQVDGIHSVSVDINVCYGDDNLGGQGSVRKNVDLAKPTGLTYSGSKLYWSSVKDAEGYEVALHNTDKNTYNAVARTSKLYYAVKKVNADYPYVVRAYYTNANGERVYSDYSSEIYMGSGKIVNLTAALQDDGIKLKWTGDSASDGYYIYRTQNGTEFTKIGETTGTSYTDSSFDPSKTQYSYYIQGFDLMGQTKRSDGVTVYLSAGKSAAPVFSNCTANTVTVTWNEMDGVSGYQLLMQNPETGAYAVKGDVKAGSDLRYTFTTLDAGGKFRFAVRAYISNGGEKKFGEISDDLIAYTAPAAVKNLTAAAIDGGVKLGWNAVPNADKYIIYRKNSTDYTKIGVVSGTAVNIKIGGSAVRQYCVAAIKVQNGKDYIGATSNVVTASGTGIGTPKITSGSYANGSITLTWTKADKASGYRIYKYDAASNTYKSVKTLSGGDTTTYTILNIASGSKETFKIKAFMRDGTEVKWGSASTAFSVKTTAPLAAPTGLEAIATNAIVKLQWNAVSGADSYNIYEVSGSNYTLIGESTTNSATVNTGAGNGKSFAVSAVSGTGSSKTSGAYSSLATVAKVPDTPVISTINNTANSVKLSWTIPSGASGVRIYLYNPTKNTYVSIKTLSNKKNVLTIKNLSAGSSYKFKAKAYIRTSTGLTWGKASNAYTAYTLS